MIKVFITFLTIFTAPVLSNSIACTSNNLTSIKLSNKNIIRVFNTDIVIELKNNVRDSDVTLINSITFTGNIITDESQVLRVNEVSQSIEAFSLYNYTISGLEICSIIFKDRFKRNDLGDGEDLEEAIIELAKSCIESQVCDIPNPLEALSQNFHNSMINSLATRIFEDIFVRGFPVIEKRSWWHVVKLFRGRFDHIPEFNRTEDVLVTRKNEEFLIETSFHIIDMDVFYDVEDGATWTDYGKAKLFLPDVTLPSMKISVNYNKIPCNLTLISFDLKLTKDMKIDISGLDYYVEKGIREDITKELITDTFKTEIQKSLKNITCQSIWILD